MERLWKSMQLITAVALFLGLTLISGPATAKKGEMPNGQPFQAIQGQIDGIQSRIDSIEASIADMQAQIDQLVTTNMSLADRIALNETFISQLQADNLTIKAQLDSLVDKAKALGNQVDMNTADIQNLITQHQINTAKIAYLESQIEQISDDMRGKQSILTQQCPEGSAISSISPDGTVTCETISPPNPSGFTKIMEQIKYSEEVYVPESTRRCELEILGVCWDWSEWTTPFEQKVLRCDDGFIATGGGIYVWEGFYRHEAHITLDQPVFRGWCGGMTRLPGTTNAVSFYVYVKCLKFE